MRELDNTIDRSCAEIGHAFHIARLNKQITREELALVSEIPIKVLRKIERGEGHDVPFAFFPIIAYQLGMKITCTLVENENESVCSSQDV
jgi:transcriptional regulator with XRE-family HTH domain